MRTLSVDTIAAVVADLAREAAFNLPEPVVNALHEARLRERSVTGQAALDLLLSNAREAASQGLALCQDTGLVTVFLEVGREVCLEGGDLDEVVNRALARVWLKNHLRPSMCHPLTRANTGDNTPAFLHLACAPGDKVRVRLVAKGGGSENMGRLLMLKPGAGVEGIMDEVVRTVDLAGPNPCPPVIVGVGIGGSFDRVGLLAKRASCLRLPGEPNPDPELAALEEKLLARINGLGIGPQGFGGTVTALAVHVAMEPCHIASLPLAVNLQCVAARMKEVVL